MINNVTLGGKIVSEVTVRKSSTGISVIDLRLMYKNKKARNPVFIDIEAWGSEADSVSATAKKGGYIIVHGELRCDVWEKEGVKRSKLKITASKIIVSPDIPSATTPETPSF